MEQKKLAVMRKVLNDYDVKDFVFIMHKLETFVPMIRSCYDMFLQIDDATLTTIYGIDGLFLLNLFRSYNCSSVDDQYLLFLKNKAHEVKHEVQEFQQYLEKDVKYKELLEMQLEELHPLLRPKEITVTVDNQSEWEKVLNLPHKKPIVYGTKKRMVAKDILMVENQIPFMVLKKIDEALHSSLGSSSSSVSKFSPSIFRAFCEIHSPLKLCLESQAPSSVHHLLDYMYYSIINNVLKDNDVQPDNAPKPAGNALKVISEVSHKEIVQAYEEHQKNAEKLTCKVSKPKTPAAGNVSNFDPKIPNKDVAQVFYQTVSILETFTQSDVLLPRASKLHDKAGIQFYRLKEHEGIQNIEMTGKDIYLPRLTLNKGSDVILRNLVAYEAVTANSDSLPLNGYMELMCLLIMNKDDANYLKSQDVIVGDMGADEVAKLFTGMSGSISTTKTEEKSKLQEVIDEINRVYERQLRMKSYLLKLARWLLVVLKTIDSFVGYSWKIGALMVSVISVLILTWQSYCEFCWKISENSIFHKYRKMTFSYFGLKINIIK
ncbi:hypothetical protein Hdeb2414_s0027g00693271 [Helianthus debilis subsp. tardiflorus]